MFKVFIGTARILFHRSITVFCFVPFFSLFLPLVIIKEYYIWSHFLLKYIGYTYPVQSLSHVWVFVTTWTVPHQASLSITNSWNLLKLMSIKLVISSNHLIFCHPLSSCLQSFPAPGSFPMSQFFASGGQSIGASVLVLPMNIQDWFPLGLTDLASLVSKGLLQVFSYTTVQKHQYTHTHTHTHTCTCVPIHDFCIMCV